MGRFYLRGVEELERLQPFKDVLCCLLCACCCVQVYLEDLAELPENPWALKGLTQVYQAQGDKAAGKLQEVREKEGGPPGAGSAMYQFFRSL